ncbi:DUF3592 domain-containing protein [Streptomyces platensis]|uniref:DUF3592 domain-containing protein n=1 Tax=Streptomyces platensis TaxID=58346 RepID=UPI003319DAA6
MGSEWLILVPIPFLSMSLVRFGVYGIRRTRRLRRTGVTADGWIVRNAARQRRSDGAKRTFYYPVVAWTTEDGRTCEYESSYGNDSGFGVGAPVTVRYAPEAPDEFTIEGWAPDIPYGALTVLGAVLTVGSVTALILRFLAFWP